MNYLRAPDLQRQSKILKTPRHILFFTLILLLCVQESVWASNYNLTAVVNNDSREEDDNLRILSWNIYMLPAVVAMKGRKERAYAIVEEIKKQFKIELSNFVYY